MGCRVAQGGFLLQNSLNDSILTVLFWPAQVSLEMDDESEDEVEALAETLCECLIHRMYDPDCSNDGTYRFALLRELWASAR
jgi:hypothetical protein